MPIDVTTTTVINRPIDEVASYAADPDNAPEWRANITSVEWKTPRRLALGSRILFVARFVGQQIARTYETAEWSPGQHLLMETTEGPFPMEMTYTWEELAPEQTRMTLRNRGQPTGFLRLISPFMSLADTKDEREGSCAAKGSP